MTAVTLKYVDITHDCPWACLTTRCHVIIELIIAMMCELEVPYWSTEAPILKVMLRFRVSSMGPWLNLRLYDCCVFHLGPTLLLSFLHIMLSSLLLSLIYD